MDLNPTTHPETIKAEASREPVIAPEADVATEALVTESASRPAPQKPEGIVAENLVPTEPALPKAPPQAIAQPLAEAKPKPAEPMYISEPDRKAAEEALAPYIGSKVAAVATKDLNLDLHRYTSTDEKTGKLSYGIQLSFTGPAIQGNEITFGNEVIKALHEHTAFARVLDKDSQPFIKTHADDPTKVCVKVANLTEAQSKAVFDMLRGVPAAQALPVAATAAKDALLAEEKLPGTKVNEPVHHEQIAALEKAPTAAVAR